MYRFIPRFPTKEAWENRTFEDQLSIRSIVATMKAKEKPTIKYTGYIYFYRGIVSTYDDGTKPRTIEPFPQELRAWDALSENRTAEGIRACLDIFQTLPRLSYKARAFLNSQNRLENLDTYFYKPIPKNYQEFRHVFDLELQLSQIADHSTIESIWITGHGYFEWRSC